MCGSNEDLSFKIDQTGNCDNKGVEYPAVYISCENCASLTGLDEIIKEKEND